MNKRLVVAFVVLLCFMLLLSAAEEVPYRAASPEELGGLETAFAAWQTNNPESTGLALLDLFTPQVDSAFITADGQYAVLWLALVDENGRRLATEPGLVLAEMMEQGWKIRPLSDPATNSLAAGLPQGMLPVEALPAPLGAENAQAITPQALGGYYLPYVAGTSHRLEGSIAHFQDYPALGYPSCPIETCHYAYDFTDSGHFPLVASHAGTVVASRDSCPDGGTTCTNYILLHDSNGVYQIYLHLANNTIPDNLTANTSVLRGQYLGDTDDTGYSTSEHVHFMVTSSIWYGAGDYPWGYSVDIRFADVAINNGMPRTCYEIALFPIYDGATACLGNVNDPVNPNNDWYVSGNVGAYPPTGAISRPAAGAVVAPGSNPLMDVTVTASDDVRVKAVRLLAKINSQWTEIGPLVTQPFSPGTYDWDVDLCAVGPLNGALEVALKVWDHEGNVRAPLSARTIQVEHACPPPTSTLTLGQIYNSSALELNWTVTTAGVPLASFELQYRNEANPVWTSANTLGFGASARSTRFVGNGGSSYGFRLRALDTNGQPEAWPAGDLPEVVVALPTCVPDAYEPDDTPTQAFPLSYQVSQMRNLCGTGDPDWFKLSVADPGCTNVAVSSLGGLASVSLSVYQGAGGPLIATTHSPSLGTGVNLLFGASQAGDYYVRVDPWPANLSGTDARYQLVASPVSALFLPFIRR